MELYDKALLELVEALRINPRNALAHYDVAMVLDRKGRREDGLRVLRRALGMHPDDPLLESGVALLEERT
jgi:tetratricopeptide (TPR) repeat protein